jgi:SAM-dependent methyltransferase
VEKSSPPLITPYSVLASFYDRMMAHVSYPKWAQLTSDLLAARGLWKDPRVTPQVLEAACGTGTLAILLSKYRMQVDAFDGSKEMVERAIAKSEGLAVKPYFFHATFDDFPVGRKYDAVLCLYDSLNYILDEDGVVRFLKRAGSCLKPGGLLLFDVCTELNSLLHFNNRVDRDFGPGYRFVRRMRFKKRDQIQENHFDIHLDGPPPTRVYELHRQRIYSLDDVRGFIDQAGLELLDETDGYELRRPGPGSLRVHFLVRRGEAD